VGEPHFVRKVSDVWNERAAEQEAVETLLLLLRVLR
jgi:hypothetical protein